MSKKLTLLASCALFAVAVYSFAKDDSAAKNAAQSTQTAEEQQATEAMEGNSERAEAGDHTGAAAGGAGAGAR